MPTSEVIGAVERETIPLSGEWRFAIDSDSRGEGAGWTDPGFDASEWKVVEVPHTWSVMPDHADYEGLAWYRRSFSVAETSREAHLRLHFEAVFYFARVWLNGEYLGEHEGGYTPFEFDVTGIARHGEDNTLVVQVDNLRAPNRIPAQLSETWSYDWWNHGGIVRDVSLEVTSQIYIARQQIVAVPNLTGWNAADSARITTTITLRNTSDKTIEGVLSADVFDTEGDQSALGTSVQTGFAVPPHAMAEVELIAQVDDPALWHFDDPNLYRWSATLATIDGMVLDVAEDTFGSRLIELKDARFYLNGEPVRLVGLTRHADSPEHGLAETVTLMTADYTDLKRLNMVFSRPVHYPQHDAILDYCDRNGILLIPEVPSWQLSGFQMGLSTMEDLAIQQLTEMIREDFNHPSVWAWSVGNEIDSTSREGHTYVRRMMEAAKSLDPTRPVSFASNRLYSNPEYDAASLTDFVMMNQYFGTWGGPKGALSEALDAIHEAWPDKVVIISEFGFESRWNSLWGPDTDSMSLEDYYFIPDDVSPTGEEADVQRQHVIREQMAIYRSKPFVAGVIFWTYQDYRSRTNFIMGLVDADRNRHSSWDLLRTEYSPVILDSVEIASTSAAISLSARGPFELEMPVYTLRGYTLQWSLKTRSGDEILAEGAVPLPDLAPGESWSGDVRWEAPRENAVLTISIVRGTGFDVLSQTFEVNQP